MNAATVVVTDEDHVFSWRPVDEGFMQRTAHGLRLGGDIWLVDPIDADDLDDLLHSRGSVAGVVVTLSRHLRDSLAIASRHGVRIWADEAVGRVALGESGRRFRERIPGTPLFSIPLPGHGLRRFWHESALWWPEQGTVLVSESLGTVAYFQLGDEALGLHPFRRGDPPRELLPLPAQRLLTGHGDEIARNADRMIRECIENGPSRRKPFWMLRTLWSARRKG